MAAPNTCEQSSAHQETTIVGQSFAKNFFKMLTHPKYAAIFRQFFAKPWLNTGCFYEIPDRWLI